MRLCNIHCKAMSATQKTQVKTSRTKRPAYLVFLLICAIFAYARIILVDYQKVYEGCKDWANASQIEGVCSVVTLLCCGCVICFWFCLRRRLHDLGYSGWWVFVVIASGALCTAIGEVCVKESIILPETGVALSSSSLLICLAIGLIPSQDKDNKYGVYEEKNEIFLPDGTSKFFCCTVGLIVIIAYSALYFVAAIHVAGLKEYATQHYMHNSSRD